MSAALLLAIASNAKNAYFTASGIFVPSTPTICIAAVGSGGDGGRTSGTSAMRNGGGGGGGCCYRNAVPTTPGEVLTVTVEGAGAGRITRISRGATVLLAAYGGTDGAFNSTGIGGSFAVVPGVVGFNGSDGEYSSGIGFPGGGGGAGGFSAVGGGAGDGGRQGASGVVVSPSTPLSLGAGGGGGNSLFVSTLNDGTNGAPGSGGERGGAAGANVGGDGGSYGGGGGGGGRNGATTYTGGLGAGGLLRIIWGPGRTFPNNSA